MEVKHGYKQTEIGVVPEEWEFEQIARLESRRLVKLGRGQVISRLDIERTPGEFPIYSSSVHNEGEFGRYGCFMFDEELITWSIDGGGNFFWRPKHKFSVTNVCGFMRVDSEHICYAFLAAVLQLLHGRKSFDYQSKAHPSVIRKEYAVPLPALAEQRAIAAALSDVDALVAGLDRLIAKKRDLKQAAMQQLLAGQTRLHGFSGKWEVKPLGNLGIWRGGMTPSMRNPAFWDGGDFPWISSGDVKVSLLRGTSQHVTSWAVRKGAAIVVPGNSIVLVTRSGILRKYLPVALLEKPMAINQDIKAVVPNETVRGDFLLHALTGYGNQILARCLKSGTTVESVEFPWLKAFAIPMPPCDEQTAIATVLSEMDAELAALEARRAKIRDLKQAMMQELLTGKKRLVNPETAHA